MLLNLLIKHGYLTKEQKTWLNIKQEHRIVDALVESQLFQSDELTKILSTLFHQPIYSLNDFSFEDESLLKYKNLALKHQVLPLSICNGEMLLAISDPCYDEAQNDFRFNTEFTIKPVLVNHQELSFAIRKLYGTALLDPHLDLSIEEQNFAKLIEIADQDENNNEEIISDEAPVSHYIQQVLLDAIRKQASDIHFEPFENNYQIRFRLDGRLQLYSSPPIGISRRISSRIKIIAKLNIAERRLPQDGRLKLKIDNKTIDMRVSILPTLWGEKVVLRLLNSSNMALDFDLLGLSQEQKQDFLEALDKPQGMILVTGPTGSGKTLSLYTGINYLNTHERNISTTEDPVEIILSGINQININSEIGLDFATTLRALLRQDPDVVMVGEIRDLETAEIAIKASQTGHLVLSTLHTNSAAESITRLANMGIAFYNLAASINLIIAQRLVRKLCPHCKKTHQNTSQLQALKNHYPKLIIENIYQAQNQGCSQCNQGYLGRIGIFEVMSIKPNIMESMLNQTNAQKIQQIAYKNGMLSIADSGIEKLNKGITSLAELQRVMNL